MDPTIQSIQILQDIISNYGPPTELNIRKYRGLMHDLLVDHVRELNLLKISLEQGQVFKLIKESQQVPFEILLPQIVTYLHSNFGIDKIAAQWSIEVWAEALGIHFIYTCIADFSLQPVQGTAPLSVQFSNNCKGDVSRFEWDFGDGESSIEIDPVHVFRTPGIYTIVLRAHHDSFLSEKNLAYAVTVMYPELGAEISSNLEGGEIFLPIQFMSRCQGLINSFDWDFGDNEHSSDPNPIHVYQKPGEYHVSLTVGDGNSTFQAELLKPVIITPQKPHADFSFSIFKMDNPLFIQFTDLSHGNKSSWMWNFGDGSVSEESSPLHEYTSPGRYHVTLTVINEEYGVKDSIDKEILIKLPPLNASFSHIISEEISPLSASFTNTSKGYVTSYQWNLGDGSTSVEENPVHSYKKPGKYSVHLIVSDGVEFSKSIQNVQIGELTTTHVEPNRYESDQSSQKIKTDKGSKETIIRPQKKILDDISEVSSHNKKDSSDKNKISAQQPIKTKLGITIILIFAILVVLGVIAVFMGGFSHISKETCNLLPIPTTIPESTSTPISISNASSNSMSNGDISIKVQGNSPYSWGDEINLSGKNTVGDTVYLFFIKENGKYSSTPTSLFNLRNPPELVSPQVPASYTTVPVSSSDHSWTYSWNTSSDELQRISCFVYAVNSPEDLSTIGKTVYAKTGGIIIGAKPMPTPVISASDFDSSSSSSGGGDTF